MDLMQLAIDNLASAFLCVLLAIILWNYIQVPRNIPPGPRAWPLIGNLLYFKYPNQTYLDYERLGKEYGDIVSLWYGRRLHIVINKNSVIKETLLNRGYDFNDRNPAYLGNDYSDFMDEVFNCPLSEGWQRKKKFALKALKNAGFGTKASEEKTVREVNELIDWIRSQDGKPFDIEDGLVNLHANVILAVLLSKRYPWFSEELNHMVGAGREFYDVVENCTGFTLNLAPQYLPMWMVRLIFHKKMKEKVYGGFDKSRKIVTDVLAEKNKEILDPDNPKDFLEAYMTQREDYDEYMVINTVAIHMPDAIDSLGALGFWTMLYLCHNPEHQKICQEEIDEVCGTRQPRLSDRNDLHYVEACLLEATRLGVPLTNSLAHVVQKDTTLKGYNIPKKNTMFLANLYAASRDPEAFPDPEKFDPTRHINKEGKFYRSDSVVSFGIGRRMCVGKAMCEVELFLIYANILQHFTFKFPDDQPAPTKQPMEGNLFRRSHPFKIIAVPRY